MKTLLITNSIEQSKVYICERLQQAWGSLVKYDKRKDKNQKSFLEENEDFQIIDSNQKYNELNNDKKFVPDVVFIVPELMWENDDINEGYNVARELITHTYKLEFVQVVFLSVLDRKHISRTVDTRNKNIVEAFPHVCLLDNEIQIKFNYYSEVHYNLIKYLAISNHGRLQKIDHEMNSVKANIRLNQTSVQQNKTELLKQLDELILFQAYLKSDTNIYEEIEKIKKATANNDLISEAQAIEKIIDDINFKLSKTSASGEILVKNKKDYSVLIVEDDKKYRQFFYDILSKFYNNVYPDSGDKYPVGRKTEIFSITAMFELIKQQGTDYNIFLLDLLYKDEQGNWLNFNGLDLYQLIRKVNPYAVIRIITSLPRGIVAKVVEVILSNSEKPNTDQVLTKKYGFEALEDHILESIDKLNTECDNNSKQRNILKPFPKNGPFEWSGIPALMDELMFRDIVEFNLIKSKAENLYQLFEEEKLSRNSPEWGAGELPSPKMKTISKDIKTYFKGKLINIMVHRLIAINESIKNSYNKIYCVKYQEDVIGKITNIDVVDKGYFNKLGFRCEGNQKNGKEKDGFSEDAFQKIKMVNLFPHEKNFIFKLLRAESTLDENVLMKKFNPELDEWFKKVFFEQITYENWEELSLDFDPYVHQSIELENGNEINPEKFPDFTLKNCRDFLVSLNNNYTNPYLEPIVYLLTNNAFDEDKIGDTVIKKQINMLLDKE